MAENEKIIDEISKKNGKLRESEIVEIAGKFKVGVSKVESIRSFYGFDETGDRVCTGLPCRMRHSGSSIAPGAEDIEEESCLGYCDHAPVVRKGGKYFSVKGKELSEIEESKENFVMKKRQAISAYTASGGYSKLHESLGSNVKAGARDIVEKSGLKGMGGAGFPVIVKWKSYGGNPSKDGYLLINAHEGEPGTFKDRSLMELEPHRVLDGALIIALSNDIKHIVIGIKKEYVNAMKSLRMALEELNSSLSQNEKESLPILEIKETGGSYVTGEETALMEAIEGNRSEPRLRPPFPTEIGLYGKPTIVQNVETSSAIARLSNSHGTEIQKYYCLTGDVENPGVYSANLGIPAREMFMKYGGSDGADLKAFMPGGLSGGILPKEFLDLKLDFDSVRKAGAGMGTGAIIALSNKRCIVDTLRTVSDFFRDESCGKCMPCRYGTKEISRTLEKIASGSGTREDLESVMETAHVMVDGSICALGQAAGKTLIDSLKYFSGEINEHIDGNCPANVCSMDGDAQ